MRKSLSGNRGRDNESGLRSRSVHAGWTRDWGYRPGAEPTSDPRVADLVRAGKVRFGTFPPQYTKDSASGELKGPLIEMMRALAAHMGLSAELIEVPTPSRLVECLQSGTCDIGSLGFDPARADQVGGFTPPFMQVEFTYLVPDGTSASNVVDIDQPGNRVAVVRNHASALALGRITRHAEHVISETPDAAFDLLRSRHVHAWASARPALLDYSAKLSGSRVLPDNYGANFPAMVVPKGQDARLAYISEFIEQAKASGVVQRAIDRIGERGIAWLSLDNAERSPGGARSVSAGTSVNAPASTRPGGRV